MATLALTQSWAVTVPARSDWSVDLGSPVVTLVSSPIPGAGPFDLIFIAAVRVNNRPIGSHPWRGESMDRINTMPFRGPDGFVTVLLSNPSLRSISLLLTVSRVLLGRDGLPWPEEDAP